MKDKIVAWLTQFQDDDLIECALSALEHLLILDRTRITNSIRQFVHTQPEFGRAIICGLGSLKDSSSVVSYYAADLGAGYEAMSVQELAADHSGRPIVFCDDFLGSGGQVSGILSGWMGDGAENTLGEKRLPLFEGQKREVLQRRIGFTFAAAWQEGIDALDVTIKKYDLNATVHAGLLGDEIPLAFKNCKLHSDQRAVDRFHAKCAEVGKALLVSNAVDPAKAEERSLGYGNRAMLLATPYNVPTQTLTCLWLAGEYDGVRWEPLLPRRKKT